MKPIENPHTRRFFFRRIRRDSNSTSKFSFSPIPLSELQDASDNSRELMNSEHSTSSNNDPEDIDLENTCPLEFLRTIKEPDLLSSLKSVINILTCNEQIGCKYLKLVNKNHVYDCVGVIMDVPKVPEYAMKLKRDETFKSWPKKDIIDPKELSDAGFFFTGEIDKVQCFFCGGKLHGWQQGCNVPLFVHAQYFQKCAFLRLVVGQVFINTVQELTKKQEITLNMIQEKMALPHCIRTFYIRRCYACSSRFIYNKKQHGQSNTWVLHAMYSPHCEFLREFAGEEFIDTVQYFKKKYEIHFENIKVEMGNLLSYLEEKLSENILRENPAVKTAVSLGYKEDDVIMVATSLRKKDVIFNSERLVSELEKEKNLSQDQYCEFELETDSQASADLIRKLQEENSQLCHRLMCKICMGKDVEVVFLPCGHQVSCAQCCIALKICPLCKQKFQGIVRAFLS